MDEQIEFTFLVGSRRPISEYQQEPLYVTPAEEDVVEFLQPSVPGRTVRLRSVAAEEND